MDLASSIEILRNECVNNPKRAHEIGESIRHQVQLGQIQILELVKSLDSLLTHVDHQVRQIGVDILSFITISLDINCLNEKEIDVLSEFMLLRLTDHKLMEKPTLECLSYFLDCKCKPNGFDQKLMEFLKTKTNVQRMDPRSRYLALDIVIKILINHKKTSNTLDSDLLYSTLNVMEGESNPEAILKCFRIVSFILKNFVGIEPYIDDLFEWLSSYFPIDYTPSSNDESVATMNIKRSDLVEALYDCFYCNPLNAGHLLTILLGNLDSNVSSTKYESLECLIKCYRTFPLENIEGYSSSLWSSIRMQCLQKIELVDPKLLELSYQTLSALGTKLSESDEIFFSFISDMLDEIAISFRKPEMELFEPAARLIVSVAKPKVAAFDFLLDRILPVSIAAMSAGELKPIPGLTYIFKQLYLHHSGGTLHPRIDLVMNKLVLLVAELFGQSENAVRLFLAIIRFGVALDSETLNRSIHRLKEAIQKFPGLIEECLALMCRRYDRFDIIFGDQQISIQSSNKLSDLLELVSLFELTGENSCGGGDNLLLYLRLITITLDDAQVSDEDLPPKDQLAKFLSSLRNLAIRHRSKRQIVEEIRNIHAVILCKVGNQLIPPLVMEIFSSEYCQALIPVTENNEFPTSVYLEVLKGVLKSLVVRNHQLSAPIINLILNFATLDHIDDDLGMFAVRIFSSIPTDGELSLILETGKHYNVFPFYKHKFFAKIVNEVRIRIENEVDQAKKTILICVAAFQLTHLDPDIYEKDIEWLIRELLRILSKLESDVGGSSSKLVSPILECIDQSIKREIRGKLSGMLRSLTDLCLRYARNSVSLQNRRLALSCLRRISESFEESELLILRPEVVSGLKPCLADKKRIVRSAAAEARLKWILIGQPIGS